MTTVQAISFKTKRFLFLPLTKEIQFNFNLEAAVFSLLFWTVVVAFMELTLFRVLLHMSPSDVVWARLIGAPFNFFIGGYYQGIYDSFNGGLRLSPKVSKYGAIGVIKLVVNTLIYSSKWFTGNHFMVSTVLVKASLVVLVGVLLTSVFTRGYRLFLYLLLQKRRQKMLTLVTVEKQVMQKHEEHLFV
jgi:hypothetical protein